MKFKLVFVKKGPDQQPVCNNPWICTGDLYSITVWLISKSKSNPYLIFNLLVYVHHYY
jgi:hypothetical protein